VHDLLELYTNKNLKVVYNPQKIEFNLQNYLKLTGEPVLAKPLKQILHD
jgi:hypothetical protein